MLDLVMRFLSHLLIPMFMVGMGGASVVVVITLISDFADFLSDSGNEDTTHEGLS